MKKSAVLVGAMLVASAMMGGVPAKAADLYGGSLKDEPVYAPPPAFSWTGYYLGLQTGYEWGKAKHRAWWTDGPDDVFDSGRSNPKGWIGGG